MAKNKESQLAYLQMPLPKGRKRYRMAKRSWSGLNYRHTVDTGALSMEKNISSLEAPYLVPSERFINISEYENPISMFGFDDFLLIIYRVHDAIRVDYVVLDDTGAYAAYTSTLQESGATEEDEYPRCVVPFNVYDTPTDPLTGKYVKKLLIYPDCKSMDFKVSRGGFDIKDMNVDVVAYTNETKPYLPPSDADKTKYYKNTYNQDVYKWVESEDDSSESAWKISVPPAGPRLKYATAHLSRIFGVDEDRVYVSGYNDYTNWNLDTVDSYNESNAWCSPAQSNTKAGGDFTGIINFQGHVVCFKRDFMHEIYNTKNPFRIQDIYAEGAIDQRTIQDVDGKLIFVSEDDVKVYTGSNPRIIGYDLNMSGYVNAVSGTDGRCYYLYCEDARRNKRLFAYDTFVDAWSEYDIDNALQGYTSEGDHRVLSFAHNKNGMYMLCSNGLLFKLDSGSYNHSWGFETDLITNQTVSIKHIGKIQLFADIASGSSIKVYVLYDDEEFDSSRSHLVYSGSEPGQKAIRVKPRQTVNYGIKLHIEGFGYVKLYELELFMENGGELYA